MATNTYATSKLNDLVAPMYLKSVNLLNYDYEVIDYFSRKYKRFDGHQLKIPFVGIRRGHGKFINEAGSLPTPNAGSKSVLQFNVKEFVDRISVSWKFMAADSSDAAIKEHSLEKLQIADEENREYIDQKSIYGGLVPGLGSERMDAAVIAASKMNASTALAAPYVGLFYTTVGAELDYDGDHTRFAGASLADPASWIPININFLDDYMPLSVGNGLTIAAGKSAALYITSSNPDADSITVNLVSDDNSAGTAFLIDNSVIADGYAWAVEFSDSVGVNVGSSLVKIGNPQDGTGKDSDVSVELFGMFHNLAARTFGGLDRSLAKHETLRAVCFTMAATGIHTRTDIDALQHKKFLATIHVRGRKKPTTMWCHPLTEARYFAAIETTGANGTARRQIGNSSSADVGVEILKFNGYAFRLSNNMPEGMLAFTNKESWCVYTADKGKKLFDWRATGETGDKRRNIFYDDHQTAQCVATLYGIFQVICTRPNKGNGLMCGISI